MVFLYHAIVLSSIDTIGGWERGLAVLAELSIQGFFIVSGALVYGSFERSKGLVDYAGKRFRRLYPAYAIIVLVPSLFSFGMSFGQAGAFREILQYLGANLIFLNFLQPNLPGLFEGQRFTEVNGALWTLKIEVLFYLVLPVLAWFLTKLGRYWWLGIALLVIGAFAWRELALASNHSLSFQLARQLPGQMMFFAGGMALWRLWGLAKAQSAALLGIGLFVMLVALFIPGLDSLRVLGLTALIAGVAFMPGPELNAARWGDISYGVYIVHFPIVQALVALGVFTAIGAYAGLALSAVLVFGVSYLLWWWVEKPSLRRDSHYRRVSEGKDES